MSKKPNYSNVKMINYVPPTQEEIEKARLMVARMSPKLARGKKSPFDVEFELLEMLGISEKQVGFVDA